MKAHRRRLGSRIATSEGIAAYEGRGQQSNSMFTKLNAEFGCKSQPNSMFVVMNIESDCMLKPNSRFVRVNIDFGWGLAQHGIAIA